MKKLALLFSIIVLASGICLAQTSGFTYQGKLADAGAPATGPYDLTFKLFPIVSGGAQIGADVVRDDVQVTTGVFTVSLDFGSSPFTSDTARYLEIAVRPGASTGAYTTLVPRQPITSSPYSVSTIRAASADVATNALQLGGVTASQFVQTGDARLSDARTPTVGSTNYIQNTTTPQVSSNFNISGDGTVGGSILANSVDSNTDFKTGGVRVFFADPSDSSVNSANTFAGSLAGASNPTGQGNSYFGRGSGRLGTTGNRNSFFGAASGQSSMGDSNSLFGFLAGGNNTSTGNRNSFFGDGAGFSNTTGSNNTAIGFAANSFGSNDTGSFNSFFGSLSGLRNANGGGNNFVGFQAGSNNTSGSSNTFIGATSGSSNTVENNNTFLGNNANGFAGITNATAIGIFASVTQSNSLVLGGINGINFATADTNVGIGTSAPTEKLQVAGGNIRWSNSILQNSQGGSIELGGTNTIAGSGIPFIDFHFSGVTQDFNARIINDADGQLSVTSKLRVATLGSGSTTLCRDVNNVISDCSSSLRYKTDIMPFSNGLNFINRLRPIAFSWKKGGMKDVGFGAEDVEKISPLLVTYNAKGEIEGVKYDRLSVIFVNAFKEQQEQIKLQQERVGQQQQQLEQQQKEIDTLKQIVCGLNPKAKICRQ